MELSHLRAFQMVARTRNFTRAAAKLNLTQSAISHQIKALEQSLGEPLFIRARHGVKLSATGKIALGYVARILDEVDALRDRISGSEHSPAGSVRVAVATQALVHLFAPLLESFMRTFPGIEVSFRTTVHTEQTINDILTGTADVGFASLPVHSPVLQVTELFKDELMLVVGHTHRLASRATAALEDIRHERWVLFERGVSIRRATDDFFKRVGVRPEMALESNDTDFIVLMVERGLGLALLPPWAVRAKVEAGKVAVLRIRGHRTKRTVAMISLGRFQSSPTRAFLAFMLEHQDQLQSMAAGGPPEG